ncbi:MAG: bifunctional alpha,alpha-trehalose-phosphate synthase (UDP-forming)/trehalose-phosphatase [Coriobacteriia bacterium]
MGRLLIVSNRLPVSPEVDADGQVVFHGSVGGLATGLGAFYQRYDSLWIGWLDQPDDVALDRYSVRERLHDEHSCVPIYLDPDDVHLYYHGFSNETIWPVFHHFTQYAVFDEEYWEAYKRVNRRFADTIAEILQPDDILWINDYHLMLLPGMLRERFPDISIGFFLHIPFPSFEIFRMLPWRESIIEGLLGVDVLGFHTYDYVRHFLSSVLRLTGHDHQLGRIVIGNRVVKVDAFPMGIDYGRFAEQAEDAETDQAAERLRRDLGDRKFILSVDRLDYTKGIPARLHAYEHFLAEHPGWQRRVGLTMVAVPSREDVEHYQMLKREVDELVGRINGRYGTMDWTPVRYLYRAIPFPELVAMYREADVMLVTPLRDGMNLVAKEFVATKGDDRLGVLILSEMAGASRELGDALSVNPFDLIDIAGALGVALEMDPAEQRERLDSMQGLLSRYDVVAWATDFMEAVDEMRAMRAERGARRLTERAIERIAADYEKARRRLLLLDYDGTLVGFSRKPDAAGPDEELLGLLRKLAADGANEVVVESGRSRETLEPWLGDLNISLVAEHGALQRWRGGDWIAAPVGEALWRDDVRPIMERYVERTPGSSLEVKQYSLVWHYRGADPGLGPLRARELRDALGTLVENYDVAIVEGNRVVEVKPASLTKGRAAVDFLESDDWDFVLAIGDGRTDEEVFHVLPDDAYTVKVGIAGSRAHYRADTVADVRMLLSRLVR